MAYQFNKIITKLDLDAVVISVMYTAQREVEIYFVNLSTMNPN